MLQAPRLVLLLIFIPLVAGNSIFRDANEKTPTNKDGLMRALDAPIKSEVSATEMIDKINQEVDMEPGLYEGDIVFMPGETTNGGLEDEREKRNAQRNRKSIWTGKIVPYQISQKLINLGYRATIFAAINEFTKHTCIKWKPRKNELNWVNFIYGKGCYSSVGMRYFTHGSQDISLGKGCNHQGVIMHEMMHAVGFWHEQSRPDRDKFVEIIWENIQPGKEHNFNKYTTNAIDYLDQVYDLESIMHYGKSTFSIDYNKPTIQALGNPSRPLGQRNGFSPTDILQLNALYDCSNPSGGWSLWSEFGPCNSLCKHTRQRFCSSHDRSNCPGADRYGVETQTTNCSNKKCYAPLDGHWGRWASWSTCSVTCNSGTHTRTRKCDDPSPKNGGKDCVGVKLQTGKCELRRCGQGPFDCEFESGKMCHWKICSKSSYYPRWYHHSGPTGSCKTGPPGDHTSGSGNYMYFEASSPARKGDKACFKSQKLPATDCQRLIFWYHMYGSGMGTLNVWLESDDGAAAKRQQLWSKTGEQGTNWQQASVDISSVSKYEISFEGVRGENFRGDIAIDDVQFKNCSGTTSAPPQLQTVLDSCDFEKGTMCDWKNDLTNNVTRNRAYDWELRKGKTWSMGTGPSKDHTTGKGTYIYLEGSFPQVKGVKGRLISKQFQASSAICLDFWYNMYGKGIGSLAVYTTDGHLKVEKWKKSGDQKDEWHYKSITLNSNKSFQIIFEGIRGWTWQSDIALDDIKVVNGPCVPSH